MRTFILFIFQLSYLYANTQQVLKVNSDRPDEADGTYIIAKGHLQLEQGIIFEKERTEPGIVKTYGFQDVVLRLGMVKKMELQLLGLLAQRHQVDLKTKQTGIASARSGIKYNVNEQKCILPSFSIVGFTDLPFLTTAPFRNAHTCYSFALLFEHDLGETEIGYNAGFNIEKNKPLEWVYAISYVRDLNEKISCFIEQYSSFQKEEMAINFDGGITYEINNFLILDLAAGISANDHAHFFTFGFTYLVPNKLF